ncbi:phytanoyl-CoA dioxygenase family protein, partial [Deltaproteobacteria bacterium]|nr:phytanoyl-CoA dioxygenase family protein [Deltaproteobacteria bacterium]
SMSSVDQRIRSLDKVRQLSFTNYCQGELVTLLSSERGKIAAQAQQQLQLPDLCLHCEGATFTLSSCDGQMQVTTEETDDSCTLSLSPSAFSDLMQDLRSPIALALAGEAEILRGDMQSFIDWQPIFRALLDGQAAYQSGDIRFHDQNGEPLDLQRSFSLDDLDEEISHFLTEAGFIHIRNVFTTEEMDQVYQDIDTAMEYYHPDDGRSWWAKTAKDEHRAVRLQYFHQHSAITRRLITDDRIQRIIALTDDGHQLDDLDSNIVEALIKPLNVVEGISDLPWHKDCSLGKHSYDCCSLTMGICVTDADSESGAIAAVAGSHRCNIPSLGVKKDLDLPQRTLLASKGDITLHLSCTLHMSHAPTKAERRVMYLGFNLPGGNNSKKDEYTSSVRENASANVGRLSTSKP